MHLDNANRIITLVVLYIAVGALMVPNLQDAWSTDSPAKTWRGEVVQAGEQSVDLTGLAGFIPHEGSIWIAEPGVTFTFPATPPSGAFSIPCAMTFGGPAAGRVWQLTDIGTGAAALWRIPLTTDTMNFKISPASGGAGGPAGGGSVVAGTPMMLGAGPYEWRLIRGTGSPLSGLAATASVHAIVGVPWNVVTCGHDQADSTPELEFRDSYAYRVSKPVAGTVIPIDTAALLIAGINLNAHWILASLSILAGLSFAVLRFKVFRKLL